MTRARLDRAPGDVAAMFDRVAPRYDVVNDLLSMGQDRRWRRAVVGLAAPAAGETALDLAAGTGTSALPLRAAGADVVACDFSLGMLRVGAARHPGLPFVAGDALRLPFRSAAFDLVTISFGLRNVVDLDAALTEMARVTRPGGRLVVCEFTQPVWRPWRAVYRGYLHRVLPPLARLAASNPAAYEYLAESILAWPDRRALAERIRTSGWSTVTWRSYSGGIVALHHAVREPAP